MCARPPLLATLPPGALIDIPCPLFAFWGGGDGVIDDFIGLENQRAAFTERELPFRTLGSYSHDEALEHLGVVLPDVVDWLAGLNGNRRA